MQQTVDTIRDQFLEDASAVRTAHDVEDLKVKYLGRKGPMQNLMKSLKEVSSEERPRFGKVINDLKEEITARCDELLNTLTLSEENASLKKEAIDITLPGRRRFSGRKHPVTQIADEMIDIMIGMGFSVQYGPDIDTDYYNFEALNFPDDHPARDMQDTFYISPQLLLRTHTSNIQARVMETSKPPIRVIAPGKVYRNETITTRSHVFFQQVEALYIDENVTFADLLTTMDEFLAKLFHREIKTRYRPSFFPFVEPGMEVDVECLLCGGSGCPLCKHAGWLEVAGAGMVHPEVLKNGGIDPEKYTGYAWGMGVERIANLKFGVKDIRLYTENDMRFLKQFPSL